MWDPQVRALIWYFIPVVFQAGSSIFLLPVYTRVFSPQDYGAVSLTLSVLSITQLFVLPGIERVYLRYGFTTDKNSPYSESGGVIVRIHIVLGFVVLPLVGFVLCRMLPIYFSSLSPSFLTIGMGSLLASSFTAPLQTYYQFSNQVGRLAFVRISIGVVKIGATLVALFAFHLGPVSVLIGELVSQLVFIPANAPMIFRMQEKKATSEVAKNVLRAILAIGPNAIITVFLTSVDRFYIEKFCGAGELGVYVAASQMASVILMLITVFNKQWSYFINGAAVSGSPTDQELRELFNSSIGLFLCVGLVAIAVPISLLKGFIGLRYVASFPILPWAVAAIIMRVPAQFFGLYCFSFEFRRRMVLTSLAALVVELVLLFILVPSYGGKGAAVALISSHMIFLYVCYRYKLSMVRFSKNITLFLFSFSTIFVGTVFLRDKFAEPIWWGIFALSMILCVREVKKYLILISRISTSGSIVI